jgi:glycosyltransferase involved in cell wall biosynthesis
MPSSRRFRAPEGRDGGAGRPRPEVPTVRCLPVRVVVLTTSYPRWEGDAAGRFVADAVERIRERGVAVEVVSPAGFRHYGIAYGDGVVGNLKNEPWRALLLPAMLAGFVRAARRAARGADLVHAHWLPAGAVALAAGKPFVVQLWGTDVELARRAPRPARAVLRRARLAVCASSSLAEAARELGAREARVIPPGVDAAEGGREEADPPEVLYAGRLSPEKGVLELFEAARGMKLVVAGDGPLRARVPGALGFVAPDELARLYGRAAVVACPSRREGFGMACLEAMAHGVPVVASGVGGLLDLVVDGETGLVVPPRDVPALRTALERLLGDPELRRRLGEAAKRRARERFSWQASTDALLEVYAEASSRR